MMKRLKSLFDGLVVNTPFGMKKCRKHNIWFYGDCPMCLEEAYNGIK